MFFSDPAAKGRDLKCLVSVWDGAGATLVSGSVRSTHFHNYLLSLFDSLFSYGRHPNFWSPFGLRTSPELAIFESANWVSPHSPHLQCPYVSKFVPRKKPGKTLMMSDLCWVASLWSVQPPWDCRLRQAEWLSGWGFSRYSAQMCFDLAVERVGRSKKLGRSQGVSGGLTRTGSWHIFAIQKETTWNDL